MNALHPPEVVPAHRGKGWTVVRVGFDERGAYERWVGANFATRQQAEAAARDWEGREPSNGEDEP